MSEYPDFSAGFAGDCMGREQLSRKLVSSVPSLLSAWCTETLPLAMPVMIEFGYIIELLIPKRVFSIFFFDFFVLYFVFAVLVNGFGAIII